MKRVPRRLAVNRPINHAHRRIAVGMTDIIRVVRVPAVIRRAADEEVQADHRAEDRIRAVAVVAAVVRHAGIPAHAAERRPAWGQTDIDRLGVGVVLGKRVPVRSRLGGIVQVAALRDIKRRKLAGIDKVHAAVLRLAELHHIHILIGERDNNRSLRRV